MSHNSLRRLITKINNVQVWVPMQKSMAHEARENWQYIRFWSQQRLMEQQRREGQVEKRMFWTFLAPVQGSYHLTTKCNQPSLATKLIHCNCISYPTHHISTSYPLRIILSLQTLIIGLMKTSAGKNYTAIPGLRANDNPPF